MWALIASEEVDKENLLFITQKSHVPKIIWRHENDEQSVSEKKTLEEAEKGRPS